MGYMTTDVNTYDVKHERLSSFGEKSKLAKITTKMYGMRNPTMEVLRGRCMVSVGGTYD
jgi:hypothetical protein